MATHIWRRRRAEAAPEDTETAEPDRRRRLLTRQRPVEAVPQTVLVDRRTARKWRSRRHNPISAAIWLAAWAAALILLLGILLTWVNANPANEIVHQALRAADWLGTPFRNAFLGLDPKHQIYADWGVAAGVYLIIGRVLSWLTRW